VLRIRLNACCRCSTAMWMMGLVFDFAVRLGSSLVVVIVRTIMSLLDLDETERRRMIISVKTRDAR
jgi:hypothetical protein